MTLAYPLHPLHMIYFGKCTCWCQVVLVLLSCCCKMPSFDPPYGADCWEIRDDDDIIRTTVL